MGTETGAASSNVSYCCVEKMGPLRGDGNFDALVDKKLNTNVEKMGPLRGDGNTRLIPSSIAFAL